MEQGSTGYEHAYNLFRRRGTFGLHCAVPQDHDVPTFLDRPFWEFAGSLHESALLARFETASGLLPARLIAAASSNLCICLGALPVSFLERRTASLIAAAPATTR
jgi:hypothetical protein